MDSQYLQAIQIIKKIKYINIASITPEGMPWNSPVYTAFDNELNFYWMSWKNNQHSINIRNNQAIFVTLYDSSVPEGTGVGLYFKGQAYELSDPKEVIVGMTVYYKRINHKIKAVSEFLKNFPRRIYKFIPEKCWINSADDIKGNFIDIRKELNTNIIRQNL